MDWCLLKFRPQRSAWSKALLLILVQSAAQKSSRSVIFSAPLDSKCSKGLLNRKHSSLYTQHLPSEAALFFSIFCFFWTTGEDGRLAPTSSAAGCSFVFEFEHQPSEQQQRSCQMAAKNNRRSRGRTSSANCPKCFLFVHGGLRDVLVSPIPEVGFQRRIWFGLIANVSPPDAVRYLRSISRAGAWCRVEQQGSSILWGN